MSLNNLNEDLGEHKCENCGTTIEMVSGDVPACEACCEHENTEEVPLAGEECKDCGIYV